MVTDHVSTLKQYAGLGKNFETAIRYVEGLNPDTVEAGHYEIDGERVYANVFDRDLTQMPVTWEMHQKYADIHLVLSGSEVIGYYPLTRLAEVPAFPEDDDNVLMEGLDGTLVPLEAGEFMIALPQDVHLPNCPGKSCAHSKKMVLKVLMDEA